MLIYNLDGHVGPFDMPLCPLCGQPVMDGEPDMAIGICHESAAVIHGDCAEEAEAIQSDTVGGDHAT